MAFKVQKRFSLAASCSGMMVYEWDVAAQKMIIDDYPGNFGEIQGEIAFTRSSWENLIHINDRDNMIQNVGRCFEQGTGKIESEYRIKINNGEYKWFLDRSQVVGKDTQNSSIKVCGILMDITSEKQKEEKLKDETKAAISASKGSESEKQAILDSLKDIVQIRFLDPDLRIVWDNTGLSSRIREIRRNGKEAFCYNLIWGRSEPCTKPCSPLATFKDGRLRKKERLLEDGRTFFEVSNPVKDENGVVRGVVFTTLNITEQKQTEKDYRTTHEFLHSFLENLPAPITVYNNEGKIALVNPAWEKLVGLKRDYVIGKRFENIFSAETVSRLSLSNAEVLCSKEPVELEESIQYPSGSHYFHTVKFALHDAENHVVVGTISIDQTARKRAEKELESRKEELKRKSVRLEETNTALKVLLGQREDDQKEMERRVIMNVKELALPYVHQLKKMHLNPDQMNHILILESHLNDIVTPFMRRVITDHPDMTAREIEVATLVREGKTNKDIAELLNLSVNTIQIHRYNLRKKLGLKNKKKNLRSYLLSVEFGSDPGRKF